MSWSETQAAEWLGEEREEGDRTLVLPDRPNFVKHLVWGFTANFWDEDDAVQEGDDVNQHEGRDTGVPARRPRTGQMRRLWDRGWCNG